MSGATMTQHLQQMQMRFNDLHPRIQQAAMMVLNQPVAAQTHCAQLLGVVNGMENDHNAWVNAYFTELRQLFGPNSPTEAQAAGMSAGVGRWIAQDRIYLLLCSSTAAMVVGSHAQARATALDGLQRCDGLLAQAQGPDFGDPSLIKLRTELPSQRMSLLAQLMLTTLKLAAGPPDNLQAAGEAATWAQHTYEQATAIAPQVAALNGPMAAQIPLLTAAQALTCSASAARILGQSAAFIARMQQAIQFADAQRVILGDKPFSNWLRGWLLTSESTTDRTGQADQQINAMADEMILMYAPRAL